MTKSKLEATEILKQIALDINKGNIFCDRHIREDEVKSMLSTIFMPLIFMEVKAKRKLRKDVGMIFEYMSQASSRSVNGYPIFFSMRYLNKKDTEEVMKYYKILHKRDKNFLAKKEK